MSENSKEAATMEEMLDECIRVRSESRSQVVGRLNDLLTALNRGKPAPKSKNNHDLWVLHRDGRMVRYSNP
jgi:hypothetical protein